MKKQNQGNQWGLIPFIIAVCLSLPFLAACSSEESAQKGAENTGDTYTFKVSEASDDDAVTTRSAMKPQTVTRDLGNGMTLVGTLTEEVGAATRSTTTTPIADGTSIIAYVCKSDGTITNVKTMTVSGSSLTIHCPLGSSTIYFLIGISPSASVGGNISSVTSTNVSADWNDLYASAAVPSSSDDIGTITFHHVFTQAKVTMSSSNGSTAVEGFSSTISGIANSTATLCANGTYTTTGSAATITCNASGGTVASLSCTPVPFISTATGSSATATLTITQLKYGGNTYNYASGNTLTFSGTFAQGHRYNFTVTLKESYKKSFTTGDYYWWDAYKPFDTGNTTFDPNNHGYNPTNGNASYSCANCPTKQEAMNYLVVDLSAAVYWDNGATIAGSTTPSYTLPDGNTYHTGLWLKKGASTGSSTTVNVYPQQTVTADIRNSVNYFFLPAAGRYTSSSLQEAGTLGYYWLKTPDSGTNALSFRFTKDYAGVYTDYRATGYCLWSVQ